MILTRLQKLPKNVEDLGKLIAAKDFIPKPAQSQINRPTCHPTFTDKKVSRPTFPWVSLTKMVHGAMANTK